MTPLLVQILHMQGNDTSIVPNELILTFGFDCSNACARIETELPVADDWTVCFAV